MKNKLVAAVVQQAIGSNDKQLNLSRTREYIEEAAAQGAQLVVLQELHATQYFCQSEDVDNFELAEPLDGATFQMCNDLAAELDLVIVMSGFEKRAPGLYHNTAQVIDGNLGRVGVYRKMHIPDDPGFYEKFYFTPGDAELTDLYGFQPIETRVGKIGLLICWDQWFPEAARLMSLAGADFLVYPTAIGWDPEDDDDEQLKQKNAWQLIQRSHAVSNGVHVLVANRTGFEVSPLDDNSGINFWGGSFICGPQGEFIVEANHEEEGVFLAQLDLSRSENVRRIWPYFRDRRVDAYDNLAKRWIS